MLPWLKEQLNEWVNTNHHAIYIVSKSSSHQSIFVQVNQNSRYLILNTLLNRLYGGIHFWTQVQLFLKQWRSESNHVTNKWAFISSYSMFCGLILYDKDGGLLQIFVHIKYYMLWYFAVIKYVFEIDKGQ